MSDLRKAAEAVLERWDSPAWEWKKQGPTADLMADLRKAVAAQTQPDALALAERLASGRLAMVEQLTEEVESLRCDAERYRWLKAAVNDYDGHACFPEVPYPAPIPDRSPFDAVDAAIDAAMGEKR